MSPRRVERRPHTWRQTAIAARSRSADRRPVRACNSGWTLTKRCRALLSDCSLGCPPPPVASPLPDRRLLRTRLPPPRQALNQFLEKSDGRDKLLAAVQVGHAERVHDHRHTSVLVLHTCAPLAASPPLARPCALYQLPHPHAAAPPRHQPCLQYAAMFVAAGQPGNVKKIQASVATARKVFRIMRVGAGWVLWGVAVCERALSGCWGVAACARVLGGCWGVASCGVGAGWPLLLDVVGVALSTFSSFCN